MPVSPAPPAAPRLKFLEGLRGLAALYVVVGHLCSMADSTLGTGKPSLAPEWMQWVCKPFGHGNLAVAAFIVLSGFCLQLALFQSGPGTVESVKAFLARRARRVLPPYYACLALSLVVALTFTQWQPGRPFVQYLPVTWENVLAHVFMVHNLSPDWMYKINGVLWSIAIEVQLYLAFPFLVRVGAKLGSGRLALVGLLLTSLPLLVFPSLMKLYPWYAGLFAVGIASARLAYRPNLRQGHWPGLGWFTMVGCGLATLVLVGMRAPLVICDLAFGIGVAAGCYLGTLRGEVPGLSARPLVILGTFSYSLYLMHHPIQQVVFYFRPWWARTDLRELVFLGVVGLPLILLGTYGFHLAFERPFMRRQRPRPNHNRSVLLGLPLPVVGMTASPVAEVPRTATGVR